MAKHRVFTGKAVFDASVDRMLSLYEEGHRVIVCFSAGKDSGICLEICRIAATIAGRLPVEVAMRDEEIMVPGTFEYAERVANDPDIKFYWIIAGQPVVNIYNRAEPYFWVFDNQIPSSEWVRQPPENAIRTKHQNIDFFLNDEDYPPPKGKELIKVLGLRAQESGTRLMGLFSSNGYLTNRQKGGFRKARPIYDWTDGDVWKAIHENNWDYNKAYDTLHRMGLPKNDLRIAPPTMTVMHIKELALAAKAWPKWFDKICERLKGVRSATLFGKTAIEPHHRLGETWEETYQRECIDNAPAEWLKERTQRLADYYRRIHGKHSTQPFPDIKGCMVCKDMSWKVLSRFGYSGDPFGSKFPHTLKAIEPEFFREGAGKWGGKAAF